MNEPFEGAPTADEMFQADPTVSGASDDPAGFREQRERGLSGGTTTNAQPDSVRLIGQITQESERVVETVLQDSQFQYPVLQEPPADEEPVDVEYWAILGAGVAYTPGRTKFAHQECVWQPSTAKMVVRTGGYSGTTSAYPAFNNAENANTTAEQSIVIPAGTVVRMYRQKIAGDYFYSFSDYSTPAESTGQLLWVFVTIDGGDAGSATTPCTYTYTVKDSEGNTIATGQSPLRGRPSIGRMVGPSANHIAQAVFFGSYYGLWDVGEQPDPGPCERAA